MVKKHDYIIISAYKPTNYILNYSESSWSGIMQLVLLVVVVVTGLSVLATALDVVARRDKLMVGGRELSIKGVAWFGFETETRVFHGLWGSTTIDNVFSMLRKHNFNALRIPFSVKAVNENLQIQSHLIQHHPYITDLGMLSILDVVVKKAKEYNLMVMFDLHQLRPYSGNTPLWFDTETSFSDVKRAWKTLAQRYCNSGNVIGADIFNEPYGDANWGYGDEKDWREASTNLGNHIHQYCSKWLIFVEGVSGNVKSHPNRTGGWWGGRLDGVAQHPVELNRKNKLVYMPHVYGPSVYNQNYFNELNFPNNLPPIWHNDFGFIKKRELAPVIVGEWGGRNMGKDRQWQQAMINWLVSKNIGSFYWCVNPNSGDTGGLLKNDWKTEESDKINQLSFLPFTDVSSFL